MIPAIGQFSPSSSVMDSCKYINPPHSATDGIPFQLPPGWNCAWRHFLKAAGHTAPDSLLPEEAHPLPLEFFLSKRRKPDEFSTIRFQKPQVILIIKQNASSFATAITGHSSCCFSFFCKTPLSFPGSCNLGSFVFPSRNACKSAQLCNSCSIRSRSAVSSSFPQPD